jgi:hypothetical protein
MLKSACPSDAPGHPDWGWTEQGLVATTGLAAAFTERALDLIAARDQRAARWGWKDPRTTLLLDFWRERLPHARFAFVFRAPWEVADSIARLGARPFTDRPEYALAIWAEYNRSLLRFYRQHRDRCALLPLRLIRTAASELVAQSFARVGLTYDRSVPAEAIGRVYDEALLRSPQPEPHRLREFARRNPEAWAVWRDLNECAESLAPLPLVAAHPDPSARLSPIPPPHPRPVAPVLSVVIPCYNQGPLLLDALESVLQAEGGLHETIIVDDGSDDPATIEILKLLEWAGWRIIRQSNQGLSAARNAGIEAAAGDYILPLDADNRIRPRYIVAGVEILRQSHRVGVVYGDCELFGEQSGPREVPDFDLRRLCLGNYIDACAVIRKQAWREAGGYDTGFRYFEDWDLWLSVAERGWEFRHLPEILFDYRVRVGSLLSHGNQPELYREVVHHLAGNHPCYAEHAAELIADLSRIRVLHEESARVREGYVRSLEDDRACRLQEQERLADRLAELEQRCLRAERYALSLEAEMDLTRRQRAESETYARSLEAELAEVRRRRAEAEAYARSLEAGRREWRSQQEPALGSAGS